MRLEGLGQLKKSNDIGNRTRHLPACNIVPQSTTLPRAPPSFDVQYGYMALDSYGSQILPNTVITDSNSVRRISGCAYIYIYIYIYI
jgi:hypothetical protein